MRVPLVDLKAQYQSIRNDVNAAIQRVLDRTDFVMGTEVSAFEQEFARYAGVNEAIGVASGTAALRLSLQACGVGVDDYVITTAHSFFATSEAISQLGARPLFVDIDPVTYTLDP